MKKNILKSLPLVAFTFLVVGACQQQRADIVIADFENGSYGSWKAEGFICRNEKVIADNLQVFELESIWK